MPTVPTQKQNDGRQDINAPALVAPIESVETKATDPCWNCGQQLQDGICSKCGFDKSLLHNLDLEAEAQKQKQLANQVTKG